MNVSEIEQATGLTRANIRFYEAENLLSPRRLENGYRDYTPEDVQTLLRVKLLRQLGVNLPSIWQLQTGEASLTDVLRGRMEQIRGEVLELEQARSVCQLIVVDGIDYPALNPQTYLVLLASTHQSLEFDAVFLEPHPWRRYFARQLDFLLYGLFFDVVYFLILHVYPSLGLGYDLLSLAVQILLMFFLEPLFLHLFGTTPGKWVLGITVTDSRGGRLSYRDAMARVKEVICYGFGFFIPIFSIYRLYASYKDCKNEKLVWDEGCEYAFRDEKDRRCVAAVGAYALLFTATLLLCLNAALPPNRGPLTQAEFAENYNFYAKNLGGDYAMRLDTDLNWYNPDPENNYFSYFETPQGMFTACEAKGNLSQIQYRLHQTSEELFFFTYPEILYASFAYVGAQKGASVFNNPLSTLEKAIGHSYSARGPFSFTCIGIALTCEVSSEGFSDSGGYLYPDETGPYRIDLTFTMQP